MSDKVHFEHWCRCGAWGTFGNRNAKGVIIWTCGPDGCRVTKKEEGRAA